MSKIVITIDTEEQMVSAKVDGETYANVGSVTVYKYIPCGESECELYCNICLADEEQGDVTKRVMICTANTKEAKDITSNSKAVVISNKNGIVVASMPKSIGEIIGNILKSKKSK